MHIAFVHSHYENLGIEYISSLLKESGHKTSLVFEPALFHNFFFDKGRLHRAFDFRSQILKKMETTKPDIVAFSVISDNYGWTQDIASQIKKRIKTKIVFGGVHPTSVPEYVLKDKVADYIITGEGEYAFLDLVNCLEKGEDVSAIPNVGGWGKRGAFLNPPRKPLEDLDSLPFPDKDLFFNECGLMVSGSYMVMGSRGCNNNCSYCWNSMINRVYRDNHYFRRRTPGNVIEELKWAKQRYRVKKVTFYDEVFTSNKNWFKEFLPRYKEEIRLPFFCCVHPRDLDEEITGLLSSSGCCALNIGIQTANEEVRKKVLNRKGSNEEIVRALALLRKTNIFVYSNIILGLPGESEKDVLETLKFCSVNRSDIHSLYWLRYYPRTKIVDMARDSSILSDSQVEEINCGRTYSPYAIAGNTFRKNISRIGNLILLCGIIPPALTGFIIRKKMYKYMPSGNLLFPAILMAGWAKRLLKGKRHPFHYLNLSEYVRVYLCYLARKAAYSLGKKI